ncbi:MAG: hypothetical protein ACRDDX_04385 [Cellulosilyticaceae bacterium]
MSFCIIAESNPQDSLSQLSDTLVHKYFDGCSDFTYFPIEATTLNPCIGCFSCWLKTPGVCAIKDISTTISSHLVKDDVAIFITSLDYGCYSAPIKNVLNRSVPNILPFFSIVKGEVHHAKRYKKVAPHIIIAYNPSITPAEQETFRELSIANSINWSIAAPLIYFCKTSTDLEDAFAAISKSLSKEASSHV